MKPDRNVRVSLAVRLGALRWGHRDARRGLVYEEAVDDARVEYACTKVNPLSAASLFALNLVDVGCGVCAPRAATEAAPTREAPHRTAIAILRTI